MSSIRFLSLIAPLILAGISSAGDAAKVIKLATLAPKGSSPYKSLLAMGEAWKNGPDGGVALSVYPDGTMGGEADMVRRMRAGQLQAGLLTVTGLREIDPSVTAFQDLPLAFRSLDEAALVREKLRPKIDARLAEKGFIVLSWGDVGWVRFFSKEPVLVPADMKRVKLFTLQGSPAEDDIMKGLGWNPVPLQTADILPGLQTGLIDAVPSVPFYALAGQFYTNAKHMLALDWAPLVGATVVTKKAWDALSPDLRASALAAAQKAGAEITARNRAENDDAVEAMKKRGLVVHALTPEVAAQWRTFVEAAWPKLRGVDIPADLYDEVMSALAQLHAASTR